MNAPNKELDITQAHSEARKMARLFEVFQNTEQVFEKLKNAEDTSNRLDGVIARKERRLEEMEEEAKAIQKLFESEKEKIKIAKDKCTFDINKQKEQTQEWCNNEKAIANKVIEDAKQFRKEMEEEVEALKVQAKAAVDEKRKAEQAKEQIENRIENLRKLLG